MSWRREEKANIVVAILCVRSVDVDGNLIEISIEIDRMSEKFTKSFSIHSKWKLKKKREYCERREEMENCFWAEKWVVPYRLLSKAANKVNCTNEIARYSMNICIDSFLFAHFYHFKFRCDGLSFTFELHEKRENKFHILRASIQPCAIVTNNVDEWLLMYSRWRIV